MNIVDAEKFFPGAKVTPPPPGHKGWAGAEGSRIPHKGFVTTEVKTREQQHRTINWKNGNVDLPILSTHELARNGNRLEYDEDDGVIRNKKTNETTGFMSSAGVYWLPLLVKKDLTRKQGFGRPGRSP